MKFVTDLITLALSKSINMPLLLLENILLARTLGPAGFGQWSLLLGAATLLHTLFINWTYGITIRFGCEEWIQDQSLGKTLSNRLPLLGIGLLLILFLLMIEPFAWLHTLYAINGSTKILALLMVITLWFTFESQSILQAMGHFTKRAILMPLINIFSITTLLALSIIFKINDFFIVVTAITLLKLFAWGAICFQDVLRSHANLCFPSSTQIIESLQYGWPVIPSMALGYFSQWGNHVLLSWYLTFEDVGIWSAAYQLMLGIISLNGIFVTLLLPWLIARNKLSKHTPQHYLINVIPAILSFWLLLIIVIITFFPILFSLMMGSQFKGNDSTLLIIIFAIITSVFSSAYGILFNLQNRLSRSLIYSFIMIISNFSLSFILIPKIGITGAAIATSFSYVICHSLYIIDQHQFLKVSAYKVTILFVAALIIGCLQFFAGTDIWMRSYVGLGSLALLIVIIRKIDSVQSRYIEQFFSGRFIPISSLLQTVLIR